LKSLRLYKRFAHPAINREDRMAKRQVMFTFPQELIREPVIYSLGQQFKIVTNIRQADVTENRGWVMLELEGEDGDIEQGIAWVTSKGVRVDPVAGDVVEG
jgi:ABC-type methionine transport system ATPase subunit